MKDIYDIQDMVWDRLGFRKYAAGREAVNDLVSVGIQEWPADRLVGAVSGSTAEILAMDQLKDAMRRHIQLTHGHEPRFGFIWTIILAAVISEIVKILLAWWWNNRQNQESMLELKRRWTHG